MALFLFVVGISLFTQNAIVPFVVFTGLVLLDRSFFLSVILLTPLIETVLIVAEGITLTKLLAMFFTLWFFINLVKRNSFSFDKRFRYLFLYLLVVVAGLFNAILFGDFMALIDWNYGLVLRENFITILPKIVFSIMMYLYIKSKGVSFLLDNLRLALGVIPLSLIIVAIYFITIGNESSNWWNVVIRLTFKGADPNEFSGLFLALGIFSFYLIFLSKSRAWVLVGLISVFMVFYSVFLTFSRGGFLTFLFTLFLVALFFSKRNKRRFAIILLIGSAIVIFLFTMGILDFTPLYERFFGEHAVAAGISTLTSKRSDWWIAAIEAIKQRPIFGFGGSTYVSQWVNFQAYGKARVMHNIYFEILIKYGFIGVVLFLLIITRILRDSINILKISVGGPFQIFLIPFISLFVMLFAGLALSWEWRELLWYLIAICSSIGALTKNLRKGI